MSNRFNKIPFPPVGDKKRKEVSVSAINECGPPKKRVKKRCSVEGCTNHAKNGGVCIKHGAEVKLCSVEGCTNYAKKGGLCIRHGAKVEVKLCSVDECNNKAIKGGVCYRHGAQKKLCRVKECTNYAQKGGVCHRHGAKKKLCSVKKCSNQARIGGVCWTHGGKVERKRCSVGNCPNQRQRRGVCIIHGAYSNIASPPAQANFLCGDVQGGGNQHNASTVVEISDNEEEGGKKQSPIAGRKRKAGVDKQQSRTAASNNPIRDDDGPGEFVQEIPENKDAVVDGQNAESDKSSSGVANLKDDSEQDTSDMRAQKRARGEGNLKDDKEQDASDVAPTKGGGEGTDDAMEDGGSCGGNEYDCEGDDNGDDNEHVNSEEGEHSHVVPDEIVTTGAYDNEKENELLTLTSTLEKANNRNQRLATELKDANNTVITLTEQLKEISTELKDANNTVITLTKQLKEMSTELEGVKSRSKSERERAELLRSQLNGVEAQIDEKNVTIAELEEELEAEKVKKAEMDTQLMTTATARLEERVAKDAVTKKFEAVKLRLKIWWKSKLNDKETQLKAKSDAVVKLKAEVGKLQATKDEIQAQLQIATENEVVLRSKVEELTKKLKEVTTKFEAAESFWNSRREEKKIYAALNDTKSQLRAKSDAVTELSELNASLRNQLEKQSKGKGGIEVKEEELTDDEDITARLKERRTDKVAVSNAKMKVMAAKVDFAVMEVEKRELELEEVSDKLEKQECELEGAREMLGKQAFALEQAKAKIEELEKQQLGLNSNSRSRRGRKNAVDSLAQLPCSKTSNSNKKRVSTKSKKKNKHVVDSLQRC
eukprot:scaffold955_cov79-Skeletonema_dohrnii-CCMP3373.AAC.8